MQVGWCGWTGRIVGRRGGHTGVSSAVSLGQVSETQGSANEEGHVRDHSPNEATVRKPTRTMISPVSTSSSYHASMSCLDILLIPAERVLTCE